MIQGWITRFMRLHRERFRPPDWPTNDDEIARFALDWSDAFARIKATEDEALAASKRLGEQPNPPEFKREQIGRVIAAILARRSPSPPRIIPIDAAIEDRARSRWEALSDDGRESWRRVVRARMPELAHRDSLVEALAIGWNDDESLIPPERQPVPAAKPRSYPWSTGKPEPNVAEASTDHEHPV